MKSPREILFEKHRAARTELDSLRRAVVEKLNAANKRQETPLSLTPRFSGVDARRRIWANRFSGFLAAVRQPASLRSALLWMARNCWRELILPYRRIWAGIATAWIVIFALNFAARDNSPTVVKASPPPSPEMLIALQNQKRLFAEMLDTPKPADADRPKPSRPSPHSELILPIVTV
jgi:hypothetical protein